MFQPKYSGAARSGIDQPSAFYRGAVFLPFVITAAEGILSHHASIFLNLLANGLATKWNKSKAGVRSWIHTRLTFAVIRGSSMCVMDRQYNWKKVGLYQYDWDDTRGPFRSRRRMEGGPSVGVLTKRASTVSASPEIASVAIACTVRCPSSSSGQSASSASSDLSQQPSSLAEETTTKRYLQQNSARTRRVIVDFRTTTVADGCRDVRP